MTERDTSTSSGHGDGPAARRGAHRRQPRRASGTAASGGLLGDLEAIRALLDSAPEEATEIPVLDDVVGPAALLDEDAGALDDLLEQGLAEDLAATLDEEHQSRALDAFQRGPANEHERHGPDPQEDQARLRRPFDDAAIDALLDDGWREAAGRILGAPSADAGAAPRHDAQRGRDLNDALRARVDTEIEQWLASLVHSRIAELRRHLLAAMRDEIARFTEQFDRHERDAEHDHE